MSIDHGKQTSRTLWMQIVVCSSAWTLGRVSHLRSTREMQGRLGTDRRCIDEPPFGRGALASPFRHRDQDPTPATVNASLSN
jgi:hypothetical protein